MCENGLCSLSSVWKLHILMFNLMNYSLKYHTSGKPCWFFIFRSCGRIAFWDPDVDTDFPDPDGETDLRDPGEDRCLPELDGDVGGGIVLPSKTWWADIELNSVVISANEKDTCRSRTIPWTRWQSQTASSKSAAPQWLNDECSSFNCQL